jgi:hypothetical protein
MRVDFCTFKSTTGNEVTINPLQVRFFSSLDEDSTTIYFDDGLTVTVEATRKEVEDGLTINSD